MSSLLVKHLLSKGCKKITILNRSLPRAEALAEEFGDIEFDIHLMGDLITCVEESDVVFAASSSEEILISKDNAADMKPANDAVLLVVCLLSTVGSLGWRREAVLRYFGAEEYFELHQ